MNRLLILRLVKVFVWFALAIGLGVGIAYGLYWAAAPGLALLAALALEFYADVIGA